jgi:hypothetical protein
MTNSDDEPILPSCLHCIYSDDGDPPANEAYGKWLLCRRHPPVVFGAGGDGFTGGPGVFPRVDREGWCGEWRLSPTTQDKFPDASNYVDRTALIAEFYG